VTVRVGECIPVPARRQRHADGEPLMEQLREAMQSLLDELIQASAGLSVR
jgi:hypothetical protein